METNNNYIDDIVRKTLSEDDSSFKDAALWDRIDNTLKYKRFLRFSLNHFNIYYSIAILLVTVSFIGYYVTYNNLENSTSIKSNPTQPVNNIKDNVNPLPQNDNTVEPSVKSVSSVENVKTEQLGKTNTSSLPVIKETENNTTTNVNNELKSTKKVKIIKKQLVITDTIRKKDTIYVKKQIAPK